MPFIIVLLIVLVAILLFGPAITGFGAALVGLVTLVAATAAGAVALTIATVVLFFGVAAWLCWIFWWAADPQAAKAARRAYENNRGDTAGFLRDMDAADRRADGTDGLIFRVSDPEEHH